MDINLIYECFLNNLNQTIFNVIFITNKPSLYRYLKKILMLYTMYYTIFFSFQKEGILGDHKIHVIIHVSILVVD